MAQGDPLHESAEIENPNKNDDDEELQSDELQGVPHWQKEFRHGLVDESVPEHRASQPPGGSRALSSAGKARETASRGPSRWVNCLTLGLRQTPREPAPGQTSHQGAAHVPVSGASACRGM